MRVSEMEKISTNIFFNVCLFVADECYDYRWKGQQTSMVFLFTIIFNYFLANF